MNILLIHGSSRRISFSRVCVAGEISPLNLRRVANILIERMCALDSVTCKIGNPLWRDNGCAIITVQLARSNRE